MNSRYFAMDFNKSSSLEQVFKKQLNIGLERAREKIGQYCAYQERSHREVREKLYSMGLYENQVEELITELIADDFLNEERYARAFAGGKFRMKGWGKVKIKYELKKNGVSDYCIRKALAEIDENDYLDKLTEAGEKKMDLLKHEKNMQIRKLKVRQFLMQRGFEMDLITDFLSGKQT